MTESVSSLTTAVRRMYEAYPYPCYPLLARLGYEDGYLATSSFSALLRDAVLGRPAHGEGGPGDLILVAGSGEALPYVLRKLEPAAHRLVCVDLSRRSLLRARLRLAWTPRPVTYFEGDLMAYLGSSARTFRHIDAYGVLHHLANPTLALAKLSERLAPGGTMRIMVYNREARKWIRELARAFTLLGLDGYDRKDLARASTLLSCAREIMPALDERLGFVGRQTLSNPARFVDMFFHEREAQVPLGDWLEAARQAGLTAYALFDRYAELDDLPNPLWRMPSQRELEERVADARFENNYELYLCHRDGTVGVSSTAQRSQRFWLRLRRPPPRWFQYTETRDLPLAVRLKLWHRHVDHVTGFGGGIDDVASLLPRQVLARLARLGAVLPSQIKDQALRRSLLVPLATSPVVPPRRLAAVALRGSPLVAAIETILVEKGRFSERARDAALERFDRAQR